MLIWSTGYAVLPKQLKVLHAAASCGSAAESHDDHQQKASISAGNAFLKATGVDHKEQNRPHKATVGCFSSSNKPFHWHLDDLDMFLCVCVRVRLDR